MPHELAHLDEDLRELHQEVYEWGEREREAEHLALWTFWPVSAWLRWAVRYARQEREAAIAERDALVARRREILEADHAA